MLTRWGVPSVIACDRWREGDLREALAAVRFPVVPLVLRGMGFRDGSEDVRAFRRVALSGDMRPTRSLLMRSAMAEARCVHDDAGNAKLSKSTEGGRRVRARDDASCCVDSGRQRKATGATKTAR